MTDRLITDLGPKPGDSEWRAAQAALAASDTVIGHIDTGLHPHPALGYTDETPPANILFAEGANFHDPEATGGLPAADPLNANHGRGEYPDHGVKTLSVILGSEPGKLVGAAPGAKVLPYRVANGPVFIGEADTAAIGRAIDHALARPVTPKVFSISMGNPGFLGIAALLQYGLKAEPGLATSTTDAIDRAYEAGVPLVAAGGQIINVVSYPAGCARAISVGGISSREVHYPVGGYNQPDRIDIWAYATPVNRAAFAIVDGKVKPTHWSDPEDNDGEPSGTSYATPQVAAAAAMWLTRYADELSRLPEPWMIVESFRKALRLSARKESIPLQVAGRKMQAIRRLDTEALLKTPPALPAEKEKVGAARAFW